MSKRRQQIPPEKVPDVDFSPPAEADLRPYVVFSQLKPDGPFLYAGWLDAVDDAMAVAFSRDHYGRDQPCHRLWIIPRSAILGSDGIGEADPAPGPARPFQVFVQTLSPDERYSADVVETTDAREALAEATRRHPEAHAVWVADANRIRSTDEAAVIWETTDQTYRLARGYSKVVREKWRELRDRRSVEAYEKDDLEEAF